MTERYRAREGDTLDLIAWRRWRVGDSEDAPVPAGALEALTEANRHLAHLGPVLPVGTEVVIPPLAPAARPAPVRLWD